MNLLYSSSSQFPPLLQGSQSPKKNIIQNIIHLFVECTYTHMYSKCSECPPPPMGSSYKPLGTVIQFLYFPSMPTHNHYKRHKHAEWEYGACSLKYIHKKKINKWTIKVDWLCYKTKFVWSILRLLFPTSPGFFKLFLSSFPLGLFTLSIS